VLIEVDRDSASAESYASYQHLDLTRPYT